MSCRTCSGPDDFQPRPFACNQSETLSNRQVQCWGASGPDPRLSARPGTRSGPRSRAACLELGFAAACLCLAAGSGPSGDSWAVPASGTPSVWKVAPSSRGAGEAAGGAGSGVSWVLHLLLRALSSSEKKNWVGIWVAGFCALFRPLGQTSKITQTGQIHLKLECLSCLAQIPSGRQHPL